MRLIVRLTWHVTSNMPTMPIISAMLAWSLASNASVQDSAALLLQHHRLQLREDRLPVYGYPTAAHGSIVSP